MMVLDECVPYGADYSYTDSSAARTTRWARRSLDYYPAGTAPNLIFGITQGGFFKDLLHFVNLIVKLLQLLELMNLGQIKSVIVSILGHGFLP